MKNSFPLLALNLFVMNSWLGGISSYISLRTAWLSTISGAQRRSTRALDAEPMSCSIHEPIFSGKFLYYFVSRIIELVSASSTLFQIPSYWCVVTHLKSRPLFRGCRRALAKSMNVNSTDVRCITLCATDTAPRHGKTSNRNVILHRRRACGHVVI